MISPEAEAFRTRVKHLMQATLQLEAPLATRRVQYETAMSRGHLPSHEKGDYTLATPILVS
jgi:hypothetical protein